MKQHHISIQPFSGPLRSPLFASLITGIKKPRGVEPQGDLKKETKIPTLYVTVYDSVTLDILYRVGHDDAQGKVNVATSGGNWIIYSYWNGKTKRTEISAITLYR